MVDQEKVTTGIAVGRSAAQGDDTVAAEATVRWRGALGRMP